MDRWDQATLERALAILSRMGTERTGWRALVFGRWYYPAEPLRNDAANLLRYDGRQLMMPVHTRLVGDE